MLQSVGSPLNSSLLHGDDGDEVDCGIADSVAGLSEVVCGVTCEVGGFGFAGLFVVTEINFRYIYALTM